MTHEFDIASLEAHFHYADASLRTAASGYTHANLIAFESQEPLRPDAPIGLLLTAILVLVKRAREGDKHCQDELYKLMAQAARGATEAIKGG